MNYLKIHMRVCFLIVFQVILVNMLFSQADTSFWFVAPEVNDHHGTAPNEGHPTYFRITTFDQASDVTIELPADPSFTPIVLNIPANTTYSYEFRRGTAANELLDEIENTIDVFNVSNKGIHITATENVTCYYEISAHNNKEILSLKGKNALGQEFYVPFQTEWGNYQGSVVAPDRSYSGFDIVATEDNTQVTIIPTVDMYIFGGGVINAGTPHFVLLNRGQAFTGVPYENQPGFSHNVNDTTRLAGTKITTDKPVAVNTKDDLVYDGGGDVDFVADQLVPVDVLGYDYIVMKGKRSVSGSGDGRELVFILGTEDNTDIYVDEVLDTTINEGEQYYYEITNKATRFSTDDENKPFYVYHVSGFEGQMGGAIIPSIDKCTGSTEVAINRSTTFAFYMMILVRRDAEDDFMVNGDPTVIQASDFDTVANTPWSSALIEIAEDDFTHIALNVQTIVSNSEDVFHIGILNGKGNADCFFGYFSNFNEVDISAKILDDQSGSNALSCFGEPVQLKVEGGNSASWSPHTYLDDPYSRTPISNPLTTIEYQVTIYGYCDITKTGDVTIKVAPPVEAIFSLDKTQGCAPLEVEFNNTSLGAKYHKWDFEDDCVYDRFDTIPDSTFSEYTYNDFSFTHTFDNNTDSVVEYIVKLAVKTESCMDTLIRTITVYPEIKPEIQYSDSVGCHPLATNLSNVTVTPLDSVFYIWELGDGASKTDSAFSYIYSNITTSDTIYYVTLQATNKFQCKYYDTLPITVYPKVNASFGLDQYGFCSPDSVNISNYSSGPNLKYFWDFGDGNSTVVNTKTPFYKTYDTSDVSYLQVEYENFDIELALEDTVSGCVDTSLQTITVYPGVIATFLPDVDTTNISPLTVPFTNTSLTSLDTTYFEWEFGDGTSSNLTHPSHQFTNTNPAGSTYSVYMHASTKYNCKDTSQSIDVTVYSPIEAKINVDYTSGCSPLTVSVNNSSAGFNHRYYWTFGDGSDTTVYNKNTLYHLYSIPSNQDTLESFTIKLLVTDTVSNATSEDSVTINVFPPVQAIFASTPGNSQGCQPYSVSYTNNSSVSAFSYKWEFSDGSSSNQTTPSHSFINISDSTETFNTRLIAISKYNCADTTNYESYSVAPNIIAGMSLDTTAGCSPFDVSITNTSLNADVFLWTFGDGTNSSSTSTTISKTYNNTSLLVEYDTLRLRAEHGASGCRDSVEQLMIVYPEADVSFNRSEERGCQPLEVQFTNTSNSVAKYFYWNFGDNNTSNLASPSHTYTNSSTDSIVNSVQLTGISDYQCSDTATSSVSVMPYINANFYVDTANSCSPIKFSIFNTSLGANQYLWYIDGILDTTTTNTNSFSYEFANQSDTVRGIKIKLIARNTDYGNCTSEDSLTVYVYPRIKAEMAISDSINCHPFTVDFSSAGSVGATGVIPFKWSFGEGNNSTNPNPTHEFYNTGLNDSIFTVTLQVTSQYQCTDVISKDITVHPIVEAHFEADKSFGCPDLDVQFQNGSSQSATDFSWDFGDLGGSTLENPSHTFINNDALNKVTRTVTLTVTDNNNGGCSDTYSSQIVVYPKPTAGFTPNDTSGCHPFNIQFANQSQGTELIYYWEFDQNNTSGEASPDYTFLNSNPDTTKPYNVKLRVVSKENCFAEDSTTISVYPYLKTEFTLDEYADCTPFEVNINNNTKGATTYDWSFGDGSPNSSSEEPDKEYKVYTKDTITEYTLTLTASNIGCQQTYSKTVTIYPEVHAEFEPSSGCQPFTVDFNNLSRGYNLSYIWDFDDGGTSSVESPEHIFYNTEKTDIVRNVKLTATSEHGCKDSFDANDTIFANPQARFVIENSADCSPFTVGIKNTTDASQFIWDFGDGITKETSSKEDITHVYYNTSDNPVPYTISLEVINQNGCRDSLTQPINVFPSVQADFSQNTTVICHAQEVLFSNETPLTPSTTPLWDFGDGLLSRIDNPIHNFTNDSKTKKEYNVKLTVESEFGCKHTDSITIDVHPQPVANFDASPREQIFEQGKTSIGLTDLTNDGEWTYSWDFGDGKGKKSGDVNSYSYDSHGTLDNNYEFNITLKVSNAFCFDSVVKTIKILPPEPKAVLTASEKAGCQPFIVNLTSKSTYSNNRLWNIIYNGDTVYTSFENSPEFTLYDPGRYIVELFAFGDGGVDKTVDSLIVYPKPTSDFKVEPPVVGLFDDTLYCYNYSSEGDYYTWDFGDGTISTEEIPVHFYEKEGSYDIKLDVETEDGCKDSYTIFNAVRAEEPCSITFPNAFIPCKGGPCSDIYSDNDKKDNTFHPYYDEGINRDEYSLSVYNRWGELIFYTENYNQAWTGYYKNQLVEQGVYVYQVECKCSNGQKLSDVRNVTVFH